MKTLFYIGEVARLLGLSPQTLRYYERIGLLRPSVVNQKTAIASLPMIRCKRAM